LKPTEIPFASEQFANADELFNSFNFKPQIMQIPEFKIEVIKKGDPTPCYKHATNLVTGGISAAFAVFYLL
jgi:hypothetical protein